MATNQPAAQKGVERGVESGAAQADSALEAVVSEDLNSTEGISADSEGPKVGAGAPVHCYELKVALGPVFACVEVAAALGPLVD